VLDFTGKVPLSFPVGRFTDREQMGRGPYACGMPTNLAGWCELSRQYGSRPLAEAIAPAIALARDGVPLLDYGRFARDKTAAELQSEPRFDEWRRTFGEGAYTGSVTRVLRQPALAKTLAAIAAVGPGYLYDGPLGHAIVACLVDQGGFITTQDLAAVAPTWTEPATAPYRGLVVHVPPPPLEAFQLLLTLRILDGVDLARHEPGGADHLDTVWRAIRLAAGVRIGCNNPSPKVLAGLLSAPAVAALRARLSDGMPIEGPTEQTPTPAAPDPAQSHTTSFSVADQDGNRVCITQSLGQLYGCGIVVPGTGMCLNNFHYWGELDPNGSNALRSGQPFALPLAPSITTQDGTPVLVLGTPGGYGISQTQAQVMVQHFDFGADLQAAIDAPRARLWDSRAVNLEARVPEPVLTELRQRGHDAQPIAPWTPEVGGMQGIVIDPATGTMTGAADSRRNGYVASR
jgi:gamma-glutamyltranspeptidase/glutathione hydrolase